MAFGCICLSLTGLDGNAIEKIKKSKIKKLIITDTIDNSKRIKNNSKIEVLSFPL